ncbi:hypothetical protein [Helicobacter burdigaliensis]|uniref:hypothetical protein n=1 Tax=Helicobacter burdigaliensis TaxID=2315334 RepID=UPI000EF6D89B|nr:hypothetical protein [Helicobacter burdigaliensis]
MQKFILLFLLLFSFSYALPKVEFKNSCVPLKDFSTEQKEVLLQSYLAGEKYGFGYTLAAIAWQESCAGVYKMNFQDPSAGIYHAYIPGVIKRYKNLKQNGFTENLVGAMLVSNDEFAQKIALNDLQFWHKEHKGDWKKIIKSYNKGYSWQKNKYANTQAENYYKSIAQKVKELEAYLPKSTLAQIANSQKNPQNHYYTKNQNFTPTKTDKKSTQDSKAFLLPIYQAGNDFLEPLEKSPTLLKEFDLIEIY